MFEENKETPFKFVNSLGRQPSTLEQVEYVIFKISENGKYNHTLNFENLVNEKTAVNTVEKYFQEIATEDYYNTIKEDCILEYKNGVSKGYYLNGNIYLYSITTKGNITTLFNRNYQ